MMEETVKRSWWPFKSWRTSALVESTLVTMVPIEVAVQKLRGFIADQDAKIVKTNENELDLSIVHNGSTSNRRSDDRPVAFLVQLKLSQQHSERAGTASTPSRSYAETRIEVVIRPRRDRDRRREATTEKAHLLLGSLKSYLMAREDDGKATEPAAQ